MIRKDGKNGMYVVLDTTLTPELIEEGMIRDLIAGIQKLRKKQGLAIEQYIHLKIAFRGYTTYRSIQRHSKFIKSELRVKSISWPLQIPEGTVVKAGDTSVLVGLDKAD